MLVRVPHVSLADRLGPQKSSDAVQMFDYNALTPSLKASYNVFIPHQPNIQHQIAPKIEISTSE